jgi:nitrogen fixation/metabolism regulation signal transduction histidine kinase
MMSHQAPSSSPETVMVPLDRVATFVRQVTHDIRNNLNSLDLQSAFVAEIVEDPEAVEEVRRIRAIVQQSAKALQALSANFWSAQPSPITYSAGIFVEDLRDRLVKQHPDQAPQVQWTVEIDEAASIAIDIEMIFAAIAEVFKNSFQFREAGQPISARAFIEDGQFVLEVREAKTSVASAPEGWGREPFVSSRRGGYGLGLFRARRLLGLHGGRLEFVYDSGSALLLSRIFLPLAAS